MAACFSCGANGRRTITRYTDDWCVTNLTLKSCMISIVIQCHLIVVVLTLTRIMKSVGTGQAPVTLEWRNAPGKKHKQTQSGTRIPWYIIQLKQCMPPARQVEKVKSRVVVAVLTLTRIIKSAVTAQAPSTDGSFSIISTLTDAQLLLGFSTERSV